MIFKSARFKAMPRSHPTFHLNIDARDRDEIFTIITRVYAHTRVYVRKEKKGNGTERGETTRFDTRLRARLPIPGRDLSFISAQFALNRHVMG